MTRDRSDMQWAQAQRRGAWARLAWARATHGAYKTPTSFARAARMEPHTYAAYERDPEDSSKSTRLDIAHAREWADLLDVRWEWLFEARGTPWLDPGDEAKRMVDSLPAERQGPILAAIESMIKAAS